MGRMKADFTEVSETRKHLSFEVPSDVVEAEIDRVAQTYTRTARVPAVGAIRVSPVIGSPTVTPGAGQAIESMSCRAPRPGGS